MFEVLHIGCAAVRVGLIIGMLYPSCIASAVAVGVKARVKHIPTEEALEELRTRIDEKWDNAKMKVEVISRES